MAERLLVALALLLVGGFGNVLLRRRRGTLIERRDRAVEFHNRLGAFVEGHGRDAGSYDWLIQRSVGIQHQMGPHGYMAHFSPPFANYLVPNWAIVLNALPEIRRGLHDDILMRQGFEYAQLLKDAL